MHNRTTKSFCRIIFDFLFLFERKAEKRDWHELLDDAVIIAVSSIYTTESDEMIENTQKSPQRLHPKVLTCKQINFLFK